MPTTLSIITTSFPRELRGKAVGAWVGVAGAGAVFGLLASGLLLEVWEWQSVFAFNAIVAAVVAMMAIRLVPNSREAHPPRVDYVGGLLSVVALAGIVYGAIEGPGRGWSDAVTLGAFAVGFAALGLWVAWGFIASEPLLDPRLFRNRAFSTGVASITLQFFVFFGYVFVIVQYLQLVLDYSPLQAGFALVPMAMVLGGLSRRVPHLAQKVSRRPLAIAGLLLMAVGVGVLTQLGTDSSYWLVLAGIVPIGAGMALATSPATTDIVAALPEHKQGVASAVNDAAREVGGTLGIAVLGSVLNEQYRSGVADAARRRPPTPSCREPNSRWALPSASPQLWGTADSNWQTAHGTLSPAAWSTRSLRPPACWFWRRCSSAFSSPATRSEPPTTTSSPSRTSHRLRLTRSVRRPSDRRSCPALANDAGGATNPRRPSAVAELNVIPPRMICAARRGTPPRLAGFGVADAHIGTAGHDRNAQREATHGWSYRGASQTSSKSSFAGVTWWRWRRRSRGETSPRTRSTSVPVRVGRRREDQRRRHPRSRRLRSPLGHRCQRGPSPPRCRGQPLTLGRAVTDGAGASLNRLNRCLHRGGQRVQPRRREPASSPGLSMRDRDGH